jgi:hypothetical protein
MAGKSKRVKVQFTNPTTGQVRRFNFPLPTPDSDCPGTNPVKERVVIIRRRLSWKSMTKRRVKVI